MRKYYLGYLTDVVMVDASILASERLGGADYDGDMVKTIADPILNRCVRRNYELGHIDNWDNLPLLFIPSEGLERYRQETETLAILMGLEIDAAKSGVRPNLGEYLKRKIVRRIW